MNRTDYIVGIDPDTEKSGVALLDTKEIRLELQTLTFPELVDRIIYLRDKSRFEGKTICAVVEAGWKNSKSNFHGYYGRRGEKIAKNVGANHETGKKLIELLVHWGIPVAEMAPLPLRIDGVNMWSGPSGKITHEEFLAVTGYKASRTNQEERDAALLAWRLAGHPLRINKRKTH
ncbi:MAG: hypothetical protein IKX67_07265 [Bacteroidales bacterium]|nr:hypothetical protein [Bacteroidales bacterium]